MKHLYLLFLLGIFFQANAQEDPLYAQYLSNPLVINPAYSGLNNNLNASISYRKQWVGFEGAPVTVNASAHTSLAKNKMGLGAIVISDKNGANNNTEAYLTYAYKLKLANTNLSFGLQGGFIHYRANNGELNPYDPTDPLFNQNFSTIKPGFGAGLMLYNERFLIGLSVPRMLQPNVNLGTTAEAVETALYQQHYYASFAMVTYLSERVRLKPSILVKAVEGAPVSVDFNATFNLDERYSLGLFTRNLNTAGVITQIRFAEAYRFGYTYEMPFNNSVGSRYASHEVTLGFNLALLASHKTNITNF